jgi:CheY-like chemotaxis protein
LTHARAAQDSDPLDPQELQYARDIGRLEAQRHALRRRVQGYTGQATVLVADDDAHLRLLLTATLTGAGYAVLEAADGDEAWDLLQEHRPPAVILDGEMPGLDGWELCERLHQDPDWQPVCVVLLSGHINPEDEARAIKAGADAYLTKPFRPIQLLDTIDRYLRRSS